MTDVLLFQTNDDGEITIEGGIVQLTNSVETMAYLCLFGGNDDDDGSQDSSLTWWGNIDEPDPSRRYVSETQYLLKSIPATSSNLRRLEDAAKRDLSGFLDDGLAKIVTASVSVEGLNKVHYSILIDGISLEFSSTWGPE